MAKAELDELLLTAGHRGADKHLALVTGARGRSGQGAQNALATAGLPITCWDRRETRDLHKQALLGHDMLVNCVVTHTPDTPFFEHDDLVRERRLRVLADVTCDVTSAANMLPVNNSITTWDRPVRRLHGGDPNGRSPASHGSGPLDVIAIDNLPSLLPREASEGFSADLTLHMALSDRASADGPWSAAAAAFDEAIAGLR